MKRLLGFLIAISFAFAVWACTPPDGFTFRQNGSAYTSRGTYVNSIEIYQAKNACDSYCVCYANNIYYVSKSDIDGYRYMFYNSSGKALYFNM